MSDSICRMLRINRVGIRVGRADSTATLRAAVTSPGGCARSRIHQRWGYSILQGAILGMHLRTVVRAPIYDDPESTSEKLRGQREDGDGGETACMEKDCGDTHTS
jgi:hypothetical protein